MRGASESATVNTAMVIIKIAVLLIFAGIAFTGFQADHFASFAPEEHGNAVVCLSDTELLISASAPKTAAMLREFGYDVVEVPISEFEKLEGCPACLSVRLRAL